MNFMGWRSFSCVYTSMERQKTFRFHRKDLHLCSEDEGNSYRFGKTWRWV